METKELTLEAGSAPSDLPGPHRYLPYYSLCAAPFRASADPRLLWIGPTHQAVLDRLAKSIRDGDGIFLLTGDVGTGKTSLANRLAQVLGEAGVQVGRVHHPGGDPTDFHQVILGAFGMGRDVRTRTDFLAAFQALLDRAASAHRKLLLIVDEAQALSRPLLQEVRELSEIGTPGQRSLAILLVGQAQLATRLADDQNADVRRWITAECSLIPLGREEVASYIGHALTMAGATAEVFTDEAIGEIASLSRGAPGAINIICDRALLLGEARQIRPISGAIVQECCRRPGSPVVVKARRRTEPTRGPAGRAAKEVAGLLGRARPRLGIAVAVAATVLVGIGAQSMSPAWLMELWRGPIRKSQPPASPGLAEQDKPQTPPAAVAKADDPPVVSLAAPAPAQMGASSEPAAKAEAPVVTAPADAEIALPVRPAVRKPIDHGYRDAPIRRDAPARVESRTVAQKQPDLAPARESAEPRPTPRGRTREADLDAPDPSAIIDWLVKGAAPPKR